MNEIELMKKIVRDALWHVIYHEEELLKGQKERAAAKILFARAQVDFSEKEAIDFYNEHSEEETFNTPTDSLKYILGSHLDAPSYHEQSLIDAHEGMAAMKLLLARTGFTEKEVSVDQIKQKLAEKNT